MQSVNASDPWPVIVGFSVGDIVQVVFTSPTNKLAQLEFHPSIAELGVEWSATGSLLTVTVTLIENVNVSSVEVASGRLSVTIAGVQSARGLSPVAPTTSVVVRGSWGVPSPPAILYATAVDGGDNAGLGNGDFVVVVFDQPVATHVLPLANDTIVRRLLSFMPPVELCPGVVLRGTWLNNSALSVTFVGGIRVCLDSRTAEEREMWAVGRLRVATQPTGDLRSANGESLPSNSSAVVSYGSWGDAPSVTVMPVSASAFDAVISSPLSLRSMRTARHFLLYWTTRRFTEEALQSLPRSLSDVRRADGAITAASVACPFSAGMQCTVKNETGVTLYRSTDNSTGLALVAPVQDDERVITISRLISNETYWCLAACTNVGDTIGPYVPTSPSNVSTLPPVITSVTVPARALRTSGGDSIIVTGTTCSAGDVVVVPH